MPHVRFALLISCLLLCCCPLSVALGPFAVLLVIPCPMSVSLCSSAVCCYVAVPCLWHSAICCLTGNTMPHVCFTLLISCLLLCCCPLSVALGPFAVLLVIPYPMSVSLCSSAVCCYVAVPCLWHSAICCLACNVMPHIHFTLSISCLYCSVAFPCLWHPAHLLSYSNCNVMPHVCFTLSISCLLLCCCPMSLALSSFAVLLVMPCLMSILLCSSAVYCYVVVVPCLWHSVHLLPFSNCNVMPHACPFHFVQ